MARVKVTNAGSAAGREAFAKTKTLKPGESQSLSFTLTARNLASFDEASSSWMAEAGTCTVKVGASSEDIRQSATFTKAASEKVASVSTSVGAPR